MRYGESCTVSWRTCLELFHGRFLRCLDEPKNKGHASECKNARYSTGDSSVNFVVPDQQF